MWQTLRLAGNRLMRVGHITYSYFKKGCRKKCTRQTRKALWVVFEFTVLQRNLEELARKAMKMCLRVLKESNKSRFDSYSRQEQCIDYIPYYLSGLSRAHFFPTTFLEIAVYGHITAEMITCFSSYLYLDHTRDSVRGSGADVTSC